MTKKGKFILLAVYIATLEAIIPHERAVEHESFTPEYHDSSDLSGVRNVWDKSMNLNEPSEDFNRLDPTRPRGRLRPPRRLQQPPKVAVGPKLPKKMAGPKFPKKMAGPKIPKKIVGPKIPKKIAVPKVPKKLPGPKRRPLGDITNTRGRNNRMRPPPMMSKPPRKVLLPPPPGWPQDAGNEEVSESEHMPFNPAILGSDYGSLLPKDDENDLTFPSLLPKDDFKEGMYESEHMPFNPAIHESGYQSEKEMPQAAFDYQRYPAHHTAFIPNAGQDYLSEDIMIGPLKYDDITNERMTESDHMPFNPAFHESEYQSLGGTPIDNVGYDYQQQSEQHVPFLPNTMDIKPNTDYTGQDYMSQPVGTEAGGKM